MTLPKRPFHPQVKSGAVIPHSRILEQLITGRMMLDDLNFPELNSVEIKKAWGKYRCYVMGLLGEIAMLTGRKIKWDPKNEKIIGDPEASALLGRSYREPWIL